MSLMATTSPTKMSPPARIPASSHGDAPPKYREIASAVCPLVPTDGMHRSLPVMTSLRVAVKASKVEAADVDEASDPRQAADGSAKGHSVAAFYADDVPKGMFPAAQQRGRIFAVFARDLIWFVEAWMGEAHGLCTLHTNLTTVSPQAGRFMPCLKIPRQDQGCITSM